jgi:N-acetylmuramoyl-L-alanine amidase
MLIAAVAPLPVPQNGFLIAIDPGHGGKDFGAESEEEGYKEKQTTLTTALLVQKHLEALGYKVIMTRDRDLFVPREERAEIANEAGADLFVSVHYNAAPNKEAHGVEVFCFKKKGEAGEGTEAASLAESVLRGVIGATNANSRGVKEANFTVLRRTKMPAILVEGGFLTNREERGQLSDPKYINQIAWGIARGIDAYVQKVSGQGGLCPIATRGP